MTSGALEDPTEPFLNPNFPKCGPLEQSQQGTGITPDFRCSVVLICTLAIIRCSCSYLIENKYRIGDATIAVYCSKHQ